jgi:hypothetical protein
VVARNDRKPEVQHYVPKLLLRNFGVAGKGKELQLHVFDKQKRRSFQTSIDNIAAERAFYDLDLHGEVRSVEPLLSSMESEAKQVIEKLISERDLSCLSEEERSWFAIFLAVQRTRTRHFRETIRDSDQQFVQLLKTRGIDPNNVSNYRPLSGEEEVKRFSSVFMMRSLPEFAAQMLHKKWILMEAHPGSTFIIGDNPISLHNDQDFGFFGNLGLGVEGIQIHLPLTPTLTLALWCPKLADQITSGFQRGCSSLKNYDALMTLGNNIDRDAVLAGKKKAIEIIERTRPIAESIQLGRPVPCVAENMDFFNSLQARWAERFVMSSRSDFGLVERMLREFPHAHKGPRMRVN